MKMIMQYWSTDPDRANTKYFKKEICTTATLSTRHSRLRLHVALTRSTNGLKTGKLPKRKAVSVNRRTLDIIIFSLFLITVN